MKYYESKIVIIIVLLPFIILVKGADYYRADLVNNISDIQ
jgi:hypothetical protein